MEEVKIKVIDRIEDVLFISDVKNRLDSHIIKDLGADSLDCVEIAMGLEKDFEITISNEDIAKHWITVQEIISYIEGRVESKLKAESKLPISNFRR